MRDKLGQGRWYVSINCDKIISFFFLDFFVWFTTHHRFLIDRDTCALCSLNQACRSNMLTQAGCITLFQLNRSPALQIVFFLLVQDM